MDINDFLPKAKELVADYTNGQMDSFELVSYNGGIKPEEVYVVWSCKTLQHAKALLSTNVPDGMYYEATYNGDKKEIYFDAYEKIENQVVNVG